MGTRNRRGRTESRRCFLFSLFYSSSFVCLLRVLASRREFSEIGALFEEADERLDHEGVKLLASEILQFGHRLIVTWRGAINTVFGHRPVSIHHAYDASTDRDLFA